MKINEEVVQLFVKTILPASIVVTMRLAAESRIKKIKWPYALTSFVLGIGAAVLVDEPVRDAIESQAWATATIVGCAMMSDKIMNYMLYRLRVNVFFDIIIDGLKGVLKKWIGN